MKTENNIDNYFERVKQNPPLIDIEKVHQLINSPTAKARLQGKPYNLLKFTIMTTIFAVIISAVLFWPEDVEKSQISNDQIPNRIEAIGAKNTEIQVSEIIEAGNSAGNKANADFQQSLKPMSDEMKADIQSSVNPSSQLNAEGNTFISPVGDEKRKVNRGEKVNFDSIQPIDGNRFIVKLKPEEIERIGFSIEGQSVHYKKKTPQWNIEFIMNIFSNGSEFRSIRYTKAETKESITSSSFFPVIESDMSFFVKSGAEGNFESINDTLIPIQIPLNQISGGKYEDDLFWFTVNENLVDVLPSSYKEIAKEIMKFKTIKKLLPEKNIVLYNPKSIYEGVKFIELSKEELQKFGFSYTNKISYSVFFDSTSFKLDIDSIFKVKAKNIFKDSPKKVSIPVAISDELGRFLTDFFDLTTNNKLDFKKCIPIKISTSEEKLFIKQYFVMWFYPSDAFFKALPERISTDLRKEYNYITAEDKSSLIKPECKYFDECKNTLKVSSFKVYPNPASTFATVSFTLPEAIVGRITLVDLSGRERQILKPQTQFTIGSHNFNVDVSSVPEGIYLITLYSNKGIQTQRFIVAR